MKLQIQVWKQVQGKTTVEVDAHDVGNGLYVHLHPGVHTGRWEISHKSGLSVGDGSFKTKREAMAAARELSKFTDWNQSAGDIAKHLRERHIDLTKHIEAVYKKHGAIL